LRSARLLDGYGLTQGDDLHSSENLWWTQNTGKGIESSTRNTGGGVRATELIVEKLEPLLPAAGGESILDIGCGDALFFDRLTKFGVVEGVEPCAELVSANNPHRSRIYVCPFDERFQPARQYSVILMLDVLEHLEDPGGALRHVAHLLKSGGRFLATVPAFMALWTNHDMLNHHLTRYTKPSFRAVARESGLRIEEERYLYHWTCPVKLGVGVVERLLRSEPEPPKVPVSWMNEVLYQLSWIEQKTVTRLPMPFGSSLLVVATRAT
jgi:2-polyprenyl-3-methyl-5-hydroxy-6-metoxy-1,4-benzoquinol methylase